MYNFFFRLSNNIFNKAKLFLSNFSAEFAFFLIIINYTLERLW